LTTTDARVEAMPGTASQLSRSQILSITGNVLREDGYDATTIRRIAGRLDCAVGSIYRYFRDKRELLGAVTQEMLEPVAAALESGEAFEPSVRRYHGLATQHAETYRLMFWVAHQVSDRTEAENRLGLALKGTEATPAPANAPSPATQSVPSVVRRIIDGWGKLLGDPDQAERCWALVHGLSQLGVSVDTVVAVIVTEDVSSLKILPVGEGELGEALSVDEANTLLASGLDGEVRNESPAPDSADLVHVELVIVDSLEPAATIAPVKSDDEMNPQAIEPQIVITMTEPPRPAAKPVAAAHEADDVTLL
jgi:AcrR family transcriptional regulator